MSFAIIGNGFVGKATQILAKNNPNLHMLIYDIDPEKLTTPEGMKELMRDIKIINVLD